MKKIFACFLLVVLSLNLVACGGSSNGTAIGRNPAKTAEKWIDALENDDSQDIEKQIYNIQLALAKIEDDTVPENIEKFYAEVEAYGDQYPLAPELFRNTYSILSALLNRRSIENMSQFEEYIDALGLQMEYKDEPQQWGNVRYYTITDGSENSISALFKSKRNHGDYFSRLTYRTSERICIIGDVENSDIISGRFYVGLSSLKSKKAWSLSEAYQLAFETPGELLAAIKAEEEAEDNTVKVECSVCNGTGYVKYYYGSSDLEAILDGHDPYTTGTCTSCDGKGYSYVQAGGQKDHDSDVVCPSCYQWKDELITEQDASGTYRTWCSDCWEEYNRMMNP